MYLAAKKNQLTFSCSLKWRRSFNSLRVLLAKMRLSKILLIFLIATFIPSSLSRQALFCSGIVNNRYAFTSKLLPDNSIGTYTEFPDQRIFFVHSECLFQNRKWMQLPLASRRHWYFDIASKAIRCSIDDKMWWPLLVERDKIWCRLKIKSTKRQANNRRGEFVRCYQSC